TAYIVLEYINGIPLKTYLSNSSGSLTWEQVKELFPPIFTTLSLMHAAGVIHRGISPSTIYVTDKLELKLTGFSISAARTTNTEIACEVFAGFAAPEQYTNDINGTWTDVYGIAAVLYRCLTGCNPTEAIARTGTPMPEPMMINRDIPSTVSKAIMRGMSLPTESRICTITEFVDKLFQQPKYVGIDNNGDTPLTKQQRKKLKKQKKERAKTIAALVFAGLVLIAFAAVFAWALKQPNDTHTENETSEAAVTTTSATTTSSATSSLTVSEPIDEPPENEANILLPKFVGRRFDTVSVTYSDKFIFVPEYSYLSLEMCEQLEKEGISTESGVIFEQDIQPDTKVAAGIEIKIKVSKGPTHVKLPDYTDKNIAEYIAELNKLNIKTSQKNEETNDVPAGQIVRCSKEPDDYVDVENSETVVVYVAVPKKEEPKETTEADNTSETDNFNAHEGGIPVN
ncbi:MAG: PASTA domain-containing protein, partial [Oscillospiraceae bacterium]